MPTSIKMNTTVSSYSSGYTSGRSRSSVKGGASSLKSADSFSRRRDSSLGANFGSTRRDSLTTSSPLLPRRSGYDPAMSARNVTMTPSTQRRGSIVLDSGLGSETARYQREATMKEIRDNFERDFQKKEAKYRGYEIEKPTSIYGKKDYSDYTSIYDQVDEEHKMTAARAKILGYSSAISSQWEDSRHVMSDMYLGMKNFSTKSLAAVTKLAENGLTKTKQDYGWRKNIEEYENSVEFKNEVKQKNMERKMRNRREYFARQEEEEKQRKEEEKQRKAKQAEDRKRREQLQAEEDELQKRREERRRKQRLEEQRQQEESQLEVLPRPKPSTQFELPSQTTSSSQPQRRSMYAAIDLPPEKEKGDEEETPRLTKSNWRERARKSRLAKEAAAGRDSSVAPESIPTASEEANGESPNKIENIEEEEDEHGTKKMKNEFDLRMASLDQEMEAGKSKLAKLRERIRRAKGAIKDAEDAVKTSES